MRDQLLRDYRRRHRAHEWSIARLSEQALNLFSAFALPPRRLSCSWKPAPALLVIVENSSNLLSLNGIRLM